MELKKIMTALSHTKIDRKGQPYYIRIFLRGHSTEAWTGPINRREYASTEAAMVPGWDDEGRGRGRASSRAGTGQPGPAECSEGSLCLSSQILRCGSG